MTSGSKFSDEFERDAVAQFTERGYLVRDVSKRLGVSPYSLCAWKKKFAKVSSDEAEGSALTQSWPITDEADHAATGVRIFSLRM
ncbi:transposase [Limimaricola sp. G21655-S1]|uniref:transposase n=1 Tax=Limimaricola sp. G21655-S1 TaxID=3014768 RepID=UPI00359C78FE